MPSRQARLSVALFAGLVWGCVVYAGYTTQTGSRMPGDWLWHYRAARALLDGHDPYAVVRVVDAFPKYPFNANYLYPLPAAILTIPFAVLSVPWGVAAFVWLTVAVFAYAVTARGWGGLWAVVSACAAFGATAGQFTPLMVAAGVMPLLGGVFILKPNLGLALAAYRPSAWPALAVGAASLAAVAFLVDPRWVGHWLEAVRTNPTQGQYAAPVGVAGGPLLALAALRWRRAEARLLLAMALVPQNYFMYDQLPLFLVPSGGVQSAALAALSWLAMLVWRPHFTGSVSTAEMSAAWGPVVVLAMYLPCLLLVLSRPNAGPLPAWVESRIRGLPLWLRGRAEASAV